MEHYTDLTAQEKFSSVKAFDKNLNCRKVMFMLNLYYGIVASIPAGM